MKKNYLFRIFVIVAIALTFAVCESCNKPPISDDGPEELLFEEQILEYFEKDDTVAQVEFDKGYSAYIDFSDGPNDAFPEGSNFKKDLEKIAYLICGNKNEWSIYSLGEKVVKPINDILEQGSFVKRITEPKNDNYAPIPAALDSIVNSKKPSLLITDFEWYKENGEIEEDNYAAPQFTKWMEMGGVIKFYAFSYIEKKSIDKRMFYVVFDSPDGNLIKLFEEKLKENDNFENYDKFVMDNRSNVWTKYEGRKSGLNENLLEVFPENDKIYKGKDLELYIFESYSLDAVYDEFEDSSSNLFTHLYADLASNNAYSLGGLKLNVYDVHDDFEKYTEYRTALRNPIDSIYIDESGTQHCVCNEHEYAYMFYDTTPGTIETVVGKMLPEYKYSPKCNSTVDDVFVIKYEDVFKITPEETHIEIGFTNAFINDSIFRKKFSDKELLRLDICYDNVDYKEDIIDSIFKFNNNSCLSESVLESIKAVRPNGNVIYTYFLKFDPSSSDSDKK